jgi:hypothetical protein
MMSKALQSRVVHIDDLSTRNQFPDFIAIYSTDESFNPELLSPGVMQWSEHIYLCHTRLCDVFWLAQCQELKLNLSSLFSRILNTESGTQNFAVCGSHPWQCLVFLHYMVSQFRPGIYFLENRLNQNIYKNLSWKYWALPLEQLAAHWQSLNIKKFRLDKFQSDLSRFNRFIDKMGLSGPTALSSAEVPSISRRFSQWLGYIWQWTFTDSAELNIFPWIDRIIRPVLMVKRELEYPVNQWDCIAEFLCEDFKQLSDQFFYDRNQHINQMIWKIKLYNEQTISIEIAFRNPYSLHLDSPDFSTAILQARYVYEDLIRELQNRDTDLDLPDTMPFLEWTIEVTQFIELTPEILALFPDISEKVDHGKINDLQNKLPVEIERYQSSSSFFPEFSFGHRSDVNKATSDIDMTQWQTGSKLRPLFYFTQPEIAEQPTGQSSQYLERCGHQWWLKGDCANDRRDYFKVTDERGHSDWLYRDNLGHWFKHGIYH